MFKMQGQTGRTEYKLCYTCTLYMYVSQRRQSFPHTLRLTTIYALSHWVCIVYPSVCVCENLFSLKSWYEVYHEKKPLGYWTLVLIAYNCFTCICTIQRQMKSRQTYITHSHAHAHTPSFHKDTATDTKTHLEKQNRALVIH